MFTTVFRPLLFAAAASLSTAPLLASAPASTALPPSLNAWVKKVNARLDRAMVQPAGIHGFVLASFRRGDDGRITDIVVDGYSPEMRKVAYATLRRLGHLPPLPAGVDPRQRIRMQLMLADTPDRSTYETMRGALMALAEQKNGEFWQSQSPIMMASSKKARSQP